MASRKRACAWRASSETRRRDRTKRKKLAEFGEVRMVTPQEPAEIIRTLQTLIEQKSKSFARMGVANLFDGALEIATAVFEPGETEPAVCVGPG